MTRKIAMMSLIVGLAAGLAVGQSSQIQKDMGVHGLSGSTQSGSYPLPTGLETHEVLVPNTDTPETYDYEWASRDTTNDGANHHAQWIEGTAPYPYVPGYMQAVEFDNSNGVFHNNEGTVLMANYGASYTGFQLWGFTSDGSNYATQPAERLWSVKNQNGGDPDQSGSSGGVDTNRGGGVSVSPNNSKIAWSDYDTGQIWVLDYNPNASNTRTESGAYVGGPRMTEDRPLLGSPIVANATQGTTWINNDVVMAFTGSELIAWDISGVAAGADNPGGTGGGQIGSGSMAPTTDDGWEIVANTNDLHAPQYTDIAYNPAIDPDHIYTAVTESGYSGWIQRWAFDRETGEVTLEYDVEVYDDEAFAWDGAKAEPREIGFNSNGDLIMVSYAGSGSDDVLAFLPNALDEQTWIDLVADQIVPGTTAPSDLPSWLDGQYVSYSGMDIAYAEFIKGDADLDLDVDVNDLLAWQGSFGTTGNDHTTGDWDGDGDCDVNDLLAWQGQFGFSIANPTAPGGSSTVPEPATMSLLALGGIAAVIRRRRK